MATTEHHGDDDELADDFELRRETGVGVWVSQRESDGAVSGYDLEKHAEHGESVLVRVSKLVAFHDADDEQAQEEIPQIERQLAT